MSRRRRILLVLKTPPPYGGGEICAEYLRMGVAGHHDINVISVHDMRRTRVNQGKLEIWKVLEFSELMARYARALIRLRPGLVFMSMGKDLTPFIRDSAFFWLARLAGSNVATELAGDRFRVLDQGKCSRWYGMLVLGRMRSIRLLGKEICARHKKEGLANVVQIDNGVDVPNTEAINVPPRESVTFLFVGAHSAAKGFETLIDACRELKLRSIRFELVTLGLWESESFRQRMLRKVTAHGLESNLFTWGLCLGDRKWEAFRRSDVLVLPSQSEGQPLSVLEAFGSGMPVIATNVGAIPEIVVPERNGILIKPGDVKELADAMERMTLDRASLESMGRFNRSIYLQRFTPDRYVHNIIDWLSSLIPA